jgi:hypothetical protein
MKNVLHLILGFIISVWAWYSDFHKVNAITIIWKINKN